MVILREKGRGRFSMNLLLRASAYDTVRTRTVLPIQEINTKNRKTKRRRMVHITQTTGDDGGYRLDPDYS